MTYPIFQLKKDLGKMYKETYKDDVLIQKNLLEMGYAINRLLDQQKIMLFDDYNKVKSKIYDEMDWKKTHD